MTVVAHDPYVGFTPDASSSFVDAVVVTPSDTDDLANICRALRVQTAGDVKVTLLSGNTVILKFAAGETRMLRVRRVWAASLGSVGQIEALY